MVSRTVPPLVTYLAQVLDFRHQRGQRHPLLAVLTLACVAHAPKPRSRSGRTIMGHPFASS